MEHGNIVIDSPQNSMFWETLFIKGKKIGKQLTFVCKACLNKFRHSPALSNFLSGHKGTNLKITAAIWVGPMRTMAMEKRSDKQKADGCSMYRND